MFLNEDAFNVDEDGAGGRRGDGMRSNPVVAAPNAGRRARPTPPPTSTRSSVARPLSSSARPGSATARAAAGVSAFGAAPQPRAPPSRSASAGMGTSRHESAATFHNDLFAGEPSAGATSVGGGGAAAAAAKAAKARQLAAQKRRERQMHSGTIVQNDAMGVAAGPVSAAAGPGRPVAPGGFARPRPPEAPTARQVYAGSRQTASASSRAFTDPNARADFRGDSFNERHTNDGSYPPQRTSYGGFPREYAEPRSPGARGAPSGGFMTGSPLASPGANAGDFDRVHAFDGDIETLELDAEVVGESPDARAMRREMASHGLSGEYDPNGGRHPRDVAADRERARELAEAEKMGEKARRVAERPKPARVDVTDRRAFLTKPGPRGGPVQCHIVRRKGKSMGFGKGYPEYFLYLDGPGTKAGSPTDDATFLLSARKRKKSKSSNYVISLDEDDLARQSGNFFGKLRSNFVGTEFVIFDKGAKPGEKHFGAGSMVPQRTDLGAVLYDYNVLGTRGPRKMTGAIPRVDDASGQRAIFRSDNNGKDGIVDAVRKGQRDDIIVLRNKSPKWNDQMQAYCLNFNGRVTHASVKNFQLADDEDETEEVMLQFGKVGKDLFTMDYRYPMSALQAFAICLTSFDNKLACE